MSDIKKKKNYFNIVRPRPQEQGSRWVSKCLDEGEVTRERDRTPSFEPSVIRATRPMWLLQTT
jgi:hypothetical protein